MSFDTADVAVIAELETKAKALKAAYKAALPAIERLDAAGYPGIDLVMDDFDNHSVSDVLESLEDARIGGGDEAAYDYQTLVKRQHLSLSDAARDILDKDDGAVTLPRVEALRHYAAKRAPVTA